MGVTVLGAIATFILPFAQIYQRIFALKGSLDKPWLLIPIFLFPPFSIVPAIMMYMNMVKEGQGGEPYDYYMLIPIIINIIISLVSDYLESPIWKFILPIIPFLGGMIAYFARYYNICKDKGGLSYSKVFTDAVITQVVASLTYMLLSYLPIVGTVFSLADAVPLLPDILTGIIYMMAYIVMNMINGYDLNDYCKTSASPGRWIGAGITSIIYIGLKSFTNILPF